MSQKLLKGVSFVVLAFVFSYLSSAINSEAQFACYAASGGGSSGVSDIFGLTGSVMAGATPANNSVLVATSSTAASFKAVSTGAVKFDTGTNNFGVAACADLSDGSGTECPLTYATTSSASASSYTIASKHETWLKVTALATNVTFNAPTGATDGDRITIRLKDDGNGPYTITWNSIFIDMQDTRPTATVSNKWMDMLYIYNSTDSKYHFDAYNVQP